MSDCKEAEEFFKTISDEDGTEICEVITEAICGDGSFWTDKVDVTISEQANINISNIEADGFMTFNDVEHSFTVAVGDRDGFVFLAFDSDYTRYEDRRTVIPKSVYNCSDSNANAYLKLWARHEKSSLVHDILMDYTSCQYTNSPTTKPVAALTIRGLEVVDGETADYYRTKLKKQHAIHLLRTK